MPKHIMMAVVAAIMAAVAAKYFVGPQTDAGPVEINPAELTLDPSMLNPAETTADKSALIQKIMDVRKTNEGINFEIGQCELAINPKVEMKTPASPSILDRSVQELEADLASMQQSTQELTDQLNSCHKKLKEASLDGDFAKEKKLQEALKACRKNMEEPKQHQSQNLYGVKTTVPLEKLDQKLDVKKSIQMLSAQLEKCLAAREVASAPQDPAPGVYENPVSDPVANASASGSR